MKPTLVFATTNAGKLVELQALVGDHFSLKSAADFPDVPEVDEDQPTFEGNAVKKALTYARATKHWALADDSGLCVDALGGAPGVHSARYAPTADERIDKLLGALDGVGEAQRTARFVCVLCLASPSGETLCVRGECEGRIGLRRVGTGGFGYDPVFLLPSGRSMAELTRDEKSAVSHRGKAFLALEPRLLAVGRG